MRAVIAATEAIVPHLRLGNLVVLESTSPPRTTVDLMKPILEESGLTAGRDFMLAYSPERVLPGQILKELVANSRVIGGIDRASAEAGRDLYAVFVEGEIMVTDATTAEMVKLMENTYRDVNIAIANEFALIAEHLGIDVWEAIEIANRHPRVKILRPGPGVGGHCIAIDPWFLVEAAPEQARLIRQARLVNDSMPGHVIQRTQELLKGIEQPIIACLGLTFKPDIDDVRESPAAAIALKLLELGYHVRAYDPFVRDFRPLGVCLADSMETAVLDADLILLLVDHAQFKSLRPQNVAGIRRRQILDTRSCFDSAIWGSAGFNLVQLGHGKS
jgi:UDP-N-acetyl-D-mannosaminuronic acid dehydrogenase